MKKPLESGFDEPAPSGPALDRHEASRKAFEALHTNDTHHRSSRGKYLDLITRERWDAWCEALDHAAQEQPAPEAKPQWAISSDSENYSGDFDTREEAIAEGDELYGGEPFYIGQCEPPTPPEDLWDASDWLERVCCQDDYSHECAEDWDQSTKEQREELQREVAPILAAWLDRHNLRPTFYTINNPERIEP